MNTATSSCCIYCVLFSSWLIDCHSDEENLNARNSTNMVSERKKAEKDLTQIVAGDIQPDMDSSTSLLRQRNGPDSLD
jgi:hypothetical protein